MYQSKSTFGNPPGGEVYSEYTSTGIREYDSQKFYSPIQTNKRESTENAEPFNRSLYKTSGTKQSQLLTKLHAAPGVYFSTQKFSLIGPGKNLILNKDGREKCFIYYRNGFVECTAEGNFHGLSV